MITPNGNGSFLANGTFAGNPTSLAADGAGNLYVVAETFAQQGAYPFALVSSGGTVTPWAVPQPTAVAVDPATGNLYLTSNQTVLKVQF